MIRLALHPRSHLLARLATHQKRACPYLRRLKAYPLPWTRTRVRHRRARIEVAPMNVRQIPTPTRASRRDPGWRAPPHPCCRSQPTPSRLQSLSLRRWQRPVALGPAPPAEGMPLHKHLLRNCVHLPAAQAALTLSCAAGCCPCLPPLGWRRARACGRGGCHGCSNHRHRHTATATATATDTDLWSRRLYRLWCSRRDPTLLVLRVNRLCWLAR